MNTTQADTALRTGSRARMQRSELLDFLWQAQNTHGHIRTEDVAEAADALGVSTLDIEGVVSFYHFFHRRPAGAFTVYLNNSPVAAIKGFERMRDAFERYTGGRFGTVDASGRWGLFETACIGLSDMEPAALINFQPFTHLNSMKVRDIVGKLRQGATPAEICDPVPDHIRSVPGGDRAILLRDYDPGVAVGRLRGRKPEAVLAEIRKSGLRGMGGAFFPTGIKWASCRKAAGSPKYIVCNADEGEPGTFKDRVLLNALPGLMLEGMVVAAYAVGAEHGVIYLRAEYAWLRDKLQHTIDHFRKMNLLGRDIGGVHGFDFDIYVQLGAGAYVCGEETALLNSLEGLRGEPRNKRVFPTERGFRQQPTVINNVETLCSAAWIVRNGAQAYRSIGTKDSPGSKLFCLSGDVETPGVYEVPFGTPLGELIDLAGGAHGEIQAVLLGGAAGAFAGPEDLDVPMSFEDLRQAGLPLGSGVVTVINQGRDLRHFLLSLGHFFAHESCGKCYPCQLGTQRQLEILGRLANGGMHKGDLQALEDVGYAMTNASFCGLGMTAATAVLSAMKRWPELAA